MAAKKRNKQPEPAAATIKTPAQLEAQAPTAAQLSRRGGRETADALVVAFVLAFLIRTFVAEAFVIPTGSMAPTLMGRHKDVFSDASGARFKVNSSDDATTYLPVLRREMALGRMTPQQVQARLEGFRCLGGVGPQAREPMLLDDKQRYASMRPPWQSEVEHQPDFSGDRLVVSKYAYSFSDPERWDVVVFKYPGNSLTNYIKRVTALPGESLRIFQGDLFVKPLDAPEDAFEIARKPPEQVMAMRQFVHDTHHESQKLIDAGWPLAWSGDGWDVEKREATSHGAEVYQPIYRGEAAAGATNWLRYHHTPPTEAVWQRLGNGDARLPEGYEPTPSLVTDFTPYNTRLNLDHARQHGELTLAPRGGRPDDLGRIGVHWVGDLMVEANLAVESSAGEVSLELVEAGGHFGVTIDAATGTATFWRQAFESSDREKIASAQTSLRSGGGHRVLLANIDQQLLLWVDGSLVDVDATYETVEGDAFGDAEVPRASDADPGDLAPAGVGIAGGKLRVERLRVWRDGYYIATRWDDPSVGFTTDLPPTALKPQDRADYRGSMIDMAEDPELWYAQANRRRADFDVDEGQLFVMGDNSGWSLDSRLWAGGNQKDGGVPGGPYLERRQLVGKAICVYWPHSWYSVPFTNRMVPAWPNFADMRLVR